MHSQTVSIRQNQEFEDERFDRFDNNECKEFRLVVHSVQQIIGKFFENPGLTLETESASRSMTYSLGKVIRHNLPKKSLRLLHLLPENLHHTQ